MKVFAKYNTAAQWFSNGDMRIPWGTHRCFEGYTNFLIVFIMKF